jgi:acetyltransferase-like isoleucine patch superfamily enzyme
MLFGRFFFGRVGFSSYILFPFYLIHPKKIFIGSNVRIHHSLRCEVYDDGIVEIKDGVSIGHNCHISSCEDLIINCNVVISSNVFIGSLDHDLFENRDIPIMERVKKCKPTYIGHSVFIGTGAVILPGTHIGNNAVIGANTVVKGDISPYAVIK